MYRHRAGQWLVDSFPRLLGRRKEDVESRAKRWSVAKSGHGLGVVYLLSSCARVAGVFYSFWVFTLFPLLLLALSPR